MIIQGQPELNLTEVFVTDFGDSYHKLATDPSSELEKDARKIRRRYRSVAEYMRALSIYNEYMEWLVQKHGGGQLFGIKNKYELIEDFVPPKPRMRNTVMNKYILKNRILLSNMKHSTPLDSIEEFIDRTVVIDKDVEFTTVKMTDKVALRMLKEEGNNLSAKEIKEITNIDYLEEYFKTKNVMKEKKEKEVNISLREILSGAYVDKIKDTTEEDTIIWYKGNYMNRETVNELQVYQDLNDSGWNSMRLMKHKNVSKRVTRVMQDKDRRSKKKGKKNKKNDDFIVKIVTDNDYDTFKDFEEDMRDFTAGNLFR